MLRKPTEIYNLNEMSHDAAIALIRNIVDKGNVKVRKAYIDTVGNPQSYRRKLEREFPNIEFVVESKADANYAPCSAASVGTTAGRPSGLRAANRVWKHQNLFGPKQCKRNRAGCIRLASKSLDPCSQTFTFPTPHSPSSLAHAHAQMLCARSGKGHARQNARKLEILGIARHLP